MSDERELRERVARAIYEERWIIPQWELLDESARIDLWKMADAAIAICRQEYEAEIVRMTQERDDARSEAVAHASEFAAMIVGQECHQAEQRGLDRAATLAEQRGHVTIADAIRALTPEGGDD